MSLISRVFGGNNKQISELKQDIAALTQFSQGLSSIDQKTFELSKLMNNDSTSFDKNILIQLWKEVPEISTVISQITNRAKSVPWGHFKVTSSESLSKFNKAQADYFLGKCSFQSVVKFKELAFEPVFNAEVDRLLKNPNDLQSWSEMVEQLISYWYVTGDSYLIKLGAFAHIPYELNIMASQQTEVKVKQSFLENPFQINTTESAIECYKFNNGYGKILTYEPELILHMKAPSLIYEDGGWAKGFSPLASVILASKTLKQEYISRLSLVRDRGSMGMVVADGKAQQMPSEGDTKALYKRLQKFGLGDGKQNSYAATNGAYRWMGMSFNSGELELLNGREENLKVLARKMNVPTDLLIGDSTYNNVLTNGRIIYTSNVMPWLNDFQTKLNKLLGLNEEGELIMPIYDDIPELQQDLKTQTDIMSDQFNSKYVTREEARIGVGRQPEPEEGSFEDNTKEKDNEA